MIRYVNDFENYAAGSNYREFLFETSIGVISSISGKKVCKANTGLLFQDYWLGAEASIGRYANFEWSVLKTYARIDAGTNVLICENKVYHNMAASYSMARMQISVADGNKIRCNSEYWNGTGWVSNSGLLNVVADGNFHDMEIRVGKGSIFYRCDAETYIYSIPGGTEPSTFFYPRYKWGQNYTAYVDRHVIDSDIYGATDTSKLLIDGIGVAGIPVKLWDTTGSPPDYSLTTGPTGTIDFSTVADGTYAIGGMDARGYCFHGEVDIAGGVPV